MLVPPGLLGEAILRGETINWPTMAAIFIGYWSVGALVLLAGKTWPKWRPSNQAVSRAIEKGTHNVWVWIALLAIFAFGPSLLIAKLSPQSPVVRSSLSAPYINPLHDEVAKWKVAEGLRSSILNGNLSPNCHVTVVQLPAPYAEDFAAEFKRILDVVGWKYDRRLATKPVDKGLTVRAIYDDVKSRECADALANRLRDSGRSRNGGSLGDLHQWIVRSEAPDYLKECPAGCIEVDFGNDAGQ